MRPIDIVILEVSFPEVLSTNKMELAGVISQLVLDWGKLFATHCIQQLQAGLVMLVLGQGAPGALPLPFYPWLRILQHDVTTSL
jgi:hypothetical protein